MNFEMEVEPGMSMTIKDSTMEFEKPLRIRVEGEGSATCGLPAAIFTRSLTVSGEARIETEEAVERMIRPRRARGVQKRVLEAIEGEMTSEEIAEMTGLSQKQVQNAVTILLRKRMLVRRGKKVRRVGVERPNPGERRNLKIPVVEG